MKIKVPDLPVEVARYLLRYDEDSGLIFWRRRIGGRVKEGDRAGRKHSGRGCVQIKLFGMRLFAHQLAWLLKTGAWPTDQIDHRDRDAGNNCWSNLRLATDSQNRMNSKRRSDNRTGHKGVGYNKAHGLYYASIGVRSQRRWLGNFHTAEEAAAAYQRASAEMHGEFSRPI